MNKEFLRPRLVGMRFGQHSIPLDVMRDWVAFEELIIEVAKHIYLSENRERHRVPRGFAQKFSLRLSGIEEGSAVAVLERTLPDDQLDLEGDYFDQARGRVISAIQKADQGNLTSIGFPSAFLGYFDPFGRSLRGDEYIEFQSPESNVTVKYNLAVRKRLILKQAHVYQLSTQLRGCIIHAETSPKQQFTLELINGDKVTGSYPKELRPTVVAALGEYETPKVLVMGDVEFDANDKARRIQQTTQIDILDILDVPARLEELALLNDQWLDGRGLAPPQDGLNWISDLWANRFPNDLPNPYVYPTPEGGIQMEWTAKNNECSCSIDLNTKAAELMVVNTENGESETIDIQLDQASGWARLIAFVRQYCTEVGE